MPAAASVAPCSGRKKAVLVGINYPGSLAPLRGCINDVHNIRSFICKEWGFVDSPQTMRVLTDDSRQRESMPTRANMIQAFKWLVQGAQPGDSLFLHYSGHGGQKRDLDGDEADGMDETLCPCDYQQAGVIIDDEMFDILVRPLPAGCRLTALFDACHSGSALDLPFMYDCSGRLIMDEPPPPQNRKGRKPAVPGLKLSHGDVIMFSGCADHQTSADAVIQGRAAGAMSSALIHVFTHTSDPNHISFVEILRQMRDYLQKNRYTQVPQMSSSREMQMSYPWII